MTEWERHIGAMTLFVQDVHAAKEFYQRAFGLQAGLEDPEQVMFRFGTQYVFLHRATDLPPTSPTVLEEGRKGAGQFAIIVEDVDAVCAELTSRGVELLTSPADRPWGMRTFTFIDPDGYIWEIAQEVA